MARAIKQGQHIFIAFQDGEAVLDSQLRPRMYKSREQFEKSFPAWRDGKAELVEYAPTLTPPNEALTLEELREMDGEPVYVVPANEYSELGKWCVISIGDSDDYSCALVPGVEYWSWKFEGYGEQWLAYRRPPEGEDGDATRG